MMICIVVILSNAVWKWRRGLSGADPGPAEAGAGW
jgi:hypothetical protein